MKLTGQLISRGIAFMFLVCLAGCKKPSEKPAAETGPPTIYYKVKTTWPHDTEAFTQGLVIHNGILYESTGQEKKSWIGVIDIKTGTPDKKVILEDEYFGEGIAILNNKIYQLTYTTHKGFVYDLNTFRRIGEFTYPSEGWGITHDGVNLIMSDGSEKLTYLDTTSLKPLKKVIVTDDRGPVNKLNELEYIDGFIFANQWQTNNIFKIDPLTGKVVGKMDLTALSQNAALRNNKADVLNGIAYHGGTKLFVVTGKNWPSYYVLQLSNPNPN
jgi:glutaminyl-peptide cyclotransferase